MAAADSSSLAIPVSERDHILGPTDAPLTLLEYGDYECPICAGVHAFLKSLPREFGGQIRLVFRNFPLTNFHPRAVRAGEAAEAAGAQGKFWEMHDRIFEHPQNLTDSDLIAHAGEVGVDVPQFRRDLESHAYRPRVQEDFRGGMRSGVKSTPTFFINGLRYTGSPDAEPLLSALRAAAK